LSFVVGAFLRVVLLCDVVGRVLMNGVLGFSTGSPCINRHLWAVRCEYVPGPRAVGCGPGVAEFLAWRGGLDIEVAEPLPTVCLEAYMVSSSVDAVMLRKLVDDELSWVLNKCDFEQRIPLVGGMLHEVVLQDRAISWRTTPYVTDPSERVTTYL